MEDCGCYSSSNYLGVDRIWCNCMFWNQFPFGDNQWYSMVHLLQYGCTCWNLKSQVTYGGLFKKKYTPRIEDTVHPHRHVLGVTTCNLTLSGLLPHFFSWVYIICFKTTFSGYTQKSASPFTNSLYGRIYGLSILQLSPNLPVNPNSWQERCLGKMVSPPSWAAGSTRETELICTQNWMMKLEQKWCKNDGTPGKINMVHLRMHPRKKENHLNQTIMFRFDALIFEGVFFRTRCQGNMHGLRVA